MFPTKTALCSALAGATIALAPLDVRAAQEEAEPSVLLGFSHSGFDAAFSDPNDAGLRAAIEMLIPRLKEVRAIAAAEGEDWANFPDNMIDTACAMLGAPTYMVVTGGDFNPDTGMPAVGALLSFDVDEAQANDFQRFIMNVTGGGEGMNFQPSERFNGMTEFLTPVGPVSFGPRQANDGWRYELMLGEGLEPDEMRTLLPAGPRGQQQLFSMVLDLEALTPLSNLGLGFMAMASPQGNMMAQRFRENGVVGEGAMKIEVSSWTDGTTNTTRTVTRRARNFSASMYLPEGTLSPDDLAIVPADATAAYVGKFSPELFYKDMVAQITMSSPEAEEGINRALAMVRDELGVDVLNEFLPALGDTMAIYLSDTTGGGSLLSGVVAIKATDRDKLRDIINNLSGTAEEYLRSTGAMNGLASLRVIRTRHEGQPLVTYRLAGLPIPVAPSMTIVGDWFVMGMTPQAAMSAAEHTGRMKGRGLLDNPRFARNFDARRETVNVSFVDTERTLRDGVTTVNLLAMALGNAVTGVDADGRMIQSVLPTMTDLMDNAQPLVQHSYWDGDDLVQMNTTDGSACVTLCAVLGVGDAAPLIGGMFIGAGLAGAGAASNAFGGGWDQSDWDDDWDDDEWEDDSDPDY